MILLSKEPNFNNTSVAYALLLWDENYVMLIVGETEQNAEKQVNFELLMCMCILT